MGVAQAGLAYRIEKPVVDFRSLVGRLFDQEATAVPHPDPGQFDIRRPSDVMVQVFGDICFICNDSLAWDILAQPRASDVQRLCATLGSPTPLLVFCRYDSGGSHGYAFVEHGEVKRRRLQTTGLPDQPPLAEAGEPRAFEAPWLSAPSCLEEEEGCPREQWARVYRLGDRTASEHHLTAAMLSDGLESLFGVCPWETRRIPASHFFKLGARKKPWWRRWTGR